MSIEEKRLEFLYKAIEDSQLTIRFVDTKTSVTTFVVGLIVALLTSGLPDFANYFWNMPPVIQFISFTVIVISGLHIALTLNIAIQVVYPKTNPSQHIIKTTNLKEVFYIYELAEDGGKSVIKQTYEDYLTKLNSINSIDELIKELAYELLKVSYIREIKISNVKKMKKYLYVVLLSLPFLLCIHYIGISKYKQDENRSPNITVHCKR